MFEAPALENTHQWHRSKQQIKTSHTPCRRTISHAPAPEARIRQQLKTNRSPLDTRFCTHAVYDSDDLTPCSINHKSLARANTPFPALFFVASGCVFIDLLPSRFGEKACFTGMHIGLWGGPTASQSVLTQTGSRGKCKTPAPASPPPVPGAWCLREGRVGAATYRSLFEAKKNCNGTWTSSQESIKAKPQIDSVCM